LEFNLLIYYTIVVAIGAFHVHEGTHSPGLLALSFLIVLMSGLCVAASVFLLVGLSVDCKQMLLPWIIIILTTTLFDILYTILWLCETYRKSVQQIKKEESHTLIFYGIICVVSQYQIYRQQSGPVPYPSTDKNSLPPIEFRLIQFHNSRNQQKADKGSKKHELKGENNCLKVPKLYDSSSGSSAVEDISDGSLLTTVDDQKSDYKHLETNLDKEKEFILHMNL
ncbi:unnamed protein product, partial [Oppiella nova]